MTSAHRNGVEPTGHTLTRLAIVLQHKLLLHVGSRIGSLVERSPHVEVQFSRMGHQRLRLDDLHMAGLLVPQITQHVGRCLQQRGCFVGLALFDQQLDDEHGRLLHGDGGIGRQGVFVQQLSERILLRAIEGRGRGEEGGEDVAHVGIGEQAQFLELACLSLVHEVGRLEGCAAEWATVVALEGEGAIGNEMAARQGRSLEACLLAPEDVGRQCNQMVDKRFTCRYIPSFDEGRPVEIDAHHLVDAKGDFGKRVGADGIECMEQFFGDAEAVLLQTSRECHNGCCRHGVHVDVLATDVEKEGTVAQGYLCQNSVYHKI